MKIVLMMAVTADGKIARTRNHFPDWTSKEDKKIFAAVTKRHGVVIMGERTFLTLKKPLPGRLNVVFTLSQKPPRMRKVMWVRGNPKKVLKKLEKMGHNSAVLGGGTFLNTQFLQKKLINEIWLTIEPRIFGKGLGIFEGDFDVDLRLIGFKKINRNSVIMRYKVLN